MRRSCTIDFFGRSGTFPRFFVFAVRACACLLVLFAAVRRVRPFPLPRRWNAAPSLFLLRLLGFIFLNSSLHNIWPGETPA